MARAADRVSRRVAGAGQGYWQRMDDTESTPGDDAGRQSDDAGRQSDDIGHDQDSEPTMNAPEEGRPDGLDALTEGDEDDATGGDGTPS